MIKRPHVFWTGLALAAMLTAAAETRQQQPASPPHMHHRFDDPARYAKMFDDPARDAWQMPVRVIETLALPASASVADIGAGTGYFSMRLAKAVPRGTVYAVDIEPAMLDHMRKRAAAEQLGNIVTVLGSEKSPNLPSPVHAVIIVDTYHHIADRESYFRGLQKSLAPGARVTIIDFRKDAPDGPPPQFRFERDQIVAEMKQAGFRLEATHDFLPRQHFLIFTATP
jgi:ubiquinone/menaquinone biosynthesis C-methylase UbiE